MNVYCVLSEMFEDGGSGYEPPEWARIAVIVAAPSRGRARYLAVRSDRSFRRYGPRDWPRLWCKRIGQGLLREGVLGSPEEDKWWPRLEGWDPARRRHDRGEGQL
jgi:hypothetical protein